MDAQSQLKVIKAGFTIIRKRDEPSPGIKFKGIGTHEWKLFPEKFKSKAERDRKFNRLLEQQLFIQD